MLRLLGATRSINVRKVLWTLAEVGEAFQHEDGWGTPARPLSTPDFKALNPNALVPVIEDDGVVLWESNTICRYLAAKHNRIDLLPTSPTARAKVEMWMDWQATDLNTSWRYAFMALVRQHPDYRDAGEIAASAARWNDMMTRLDAHLARAEGTQFTLADIVLGLSAHRWEMTPIAHVILPHVKAWLANLRSRAAAAPYLAQDLP